LDRPKNRIIGYPSPVELYFWGNIFVDISIFWKNFNFLKKFQLLKKFQFFEEISIFLPKFQFLMNWVKLGSKIIRKLGSSLKFKVEIQFEFGQIIIPCWDIFLINFLDFFLSFVTKVVIIFYPLIRKYLLFFQSDRLIGTPYS